MTVEELLSAADPARALPAAYADDRSETAQALLAGVLADDPDRAARPRHRVVTARRLVGGAAVAATVAAAFAVWGGAGTGSPGRAYAVTPGDGTVRVSIHWSQLSDPAALQAALDDAGARTTVFVSDSTNSDCPVPPNTTPYSAAAVHWTSSPNADDAGFVVEPASFPSNGTFVLSAHVAPAGQEGLSTFSAGRTQLESINSFMVVGDVPACGP